MTEPYVASYLPWIFIPVTCWLFPLASMALLFFYVEREA